MKTLTVRQIPDEVHDALRIKAAANGRSMEEEVRRLIEANVDVGREPALGPRRRNGMMDKARPWRGDDARSEAERLAAVERLQKFVRDLWGGELPGDVVDRFLEEKYAETARENAKDGF